MSCPAARAARVRWHAERAQQVRFERAQQAAKGLRQRIRYAILRMPASVLVAPPRPLPWWRELWLVLRALFTRGGR